MKSPAFYATLFVLLGLFVLPLSAGYASAPPADSVQFCLPVGPDQWQRDDPRPAGKLATDRNVGEPRTVRLFYFLPNDRPYRTEVADSMKAGILDLQTFFAGQMEAHGQGNKTFRIETDDQGDPVVHRVDGDYADSHYRSRGVTAGEIEQAFDNSANVILIVMDISRRSAHGRGIGSKGSGWAMIYGEWNWFAAAHELGHSFGLHHDFRDSEYIMSYGRANPSSARLSACAAEFLAAHPYFNPDVPLDNESPPTFELVSSEYLLGSVSTPVQLRVRDDDGLHQVILFVRPKNPFLGSTPEVKACEGLAGETDTVVEFNFDGRLPSDNVGTVAEAHTTLQNTGLHPIYVVAVDTAGNRTSTASLKSFTLEAGHSPQHVATLERPNYYDIGGLAISPDGASLAIGTGGIVEMLDAAQRERITVFRHTDGNAHVNLCLAFSPDGTLLASGSANGTIKVWNVNTREVTATLEGHTDRVLSLDFSSDGTLLATGSWDRTVRLWDVATGAHRATLEGHSNGILSVSFLPDGTHVSKSNDGAVKLWNVTTKSETSAFDTDARGSVAFSPDGAVLAAPSRYGDAVKVWDVATGTENASLNHMREYHYAQMAFSPDGIHLAVSANGLIEIWDVSSEEHMATISAGSGGAGRMVFSPGGKQLIATANMAIKFWDVSEWTTSLTPVCDRTPQARDAIVAAVSGVSNCGDVTEAHLGALTSISLDRRSITSLKVGDFDGLTGLTMLRLGNNQLSTLQADIFDDLTRLRNLELHNNQLSALPAGLLEETSVLDGIWLHDNQLTTLPEGIYDKLTVLRTLNLASNKLSALPEGIFDKLTALNYLTLAANRLTTLPAGIFDGPSALYDIWLNDNQFATLPAGIFGGMTANLALRELDLTGNVVDPLPLAVSLEKVGADQFKAVAPTGAPFEMVLSFTITNGSIRGGETTITITKGSVESSPLTATRNAGTTAAVTADIGVLPDLPSNHQGYALIRSSDLPLEVIGRGEGEVQAAADFNGDGRTDFVDFFLFADAYGGTDARFDLDGNGTVDFADFFKFVDAFGT